MSKLFLGLAPVALMLSSLSAQAVTPAEVMQKHYPRYHKTSQCWEAKDPDQGSYCMQLERPKTVQTADGEKMFLIARGKKFDFQTGKEDGAHVNSGFVGVFMLTKDASNAWVLSAAKPWVPMGAFGNAPENWALAQFGPNVYGYLNTVGDMHQGYSGASAAILLNIGNQWLETGVPLEFSDEGAVGEGMGTLLEAKMTVNKDAEPQGGVFPLTLTLKGHEGKKRYNNKAYTFTFSPKAKGYIGPKAYPLFNRDY